MTTRTPSTSAPRATGSTEAKRQKAEKGDFVPQPFPRKGGTGYHPDRQPNSECPECFGEGTTSVVLHDTRDLAPEEAALFAGVKVSDKGAIEVKTHNPVEALIQVGRHLGRWSDKLLSPTNTSNPLAELVAGHSAPGIPSQL